MSFQDDDERVFRCFRCGNVEMHAFTLEALCALVNEHNQEKHSHDSNTWWKPASIRYSDYYYGPDKPTQEERCQAKYPDARPEYTRNWTTVNRHPEEWGDAERVPILTTDDKAFLEEQGVKW